jgi:galactokinase
MGVDLLVRRVLVVVQVTLMIDACDFVGAGWGGCTVSLVPESEVDSFIKKVSETYPPYKGLEGDALSEVIFATRPSTGACGAYLLLAC